MASTDEWLTDQPDLTTIPADDDVFHVVDILDTSGSPDGTSKKIKRSAMGFTDYIEFQTDLDNNFAGLVNLVVINDAPILFALRFNGMLLEAANINSAGSGIDLRMNYFLESQSALSSSAVSGRPTIIQTPSDLNLPNSYQDLVADTFSNVGGIIINNINDKQDFIITINHATTLQKTYQFFLTLYRSWGGITVDGKYRIAALP